jgi:tetratricopeptide (TPR) repeat protein
MTDLNTLLDEISGLISADTPTLADMRVKMIEVDEFVHSSDFEKLNYNDRSRFQAAYKDLREAIRKLENPGASQGGAASPGFATSLGSSEPAAAQAEAAEAPSHNAYAEQNMEEAERMFYGGRYAEAIKLYDQVLQFDPNGNEPASTAMNRKITCAPAISHRWPCRPRRPAPLARPNPPRAWDAMPTPCRC